MTEERGLAKNDVTAIGVCAPALIDRSRACWCSRPTWSGGTEHRRGVRQVNDEATSTCTTWPGRPGGRVHGGHWPKMAERRIAVRGQWGRGAIMIDGSIFHGVKASPRDRALQLPGGQEPWNCGAKGCLETRVSVTAMLRRTGHEPNQDGTLHQQLRALVQSGDPRVKRACVRWQGPWVGGVVARQPRQPDAVVIGGGSSTRAMRCSTG